MDLNAQSPLFSNTLLIVAVVIFIAIAIVWLVLYARVRRWRQQSDDQLRHARSALASIRNDMVKARRETDHYPPTDPKPYGPIAGELEQILSDVQKSYPQLVKRLNNLKAAPATSPDNLATQFLSIFWREPRHWRQCIAEFVSLDPSIQELRAQTDKTALLLTALHEMPHQVARQHKELEQAIESNLRIARELDTSGVRGDALQSGTAYVKQLQAGLLASSPHFLRDSKEIALDQISKKDVIAAWDAIEQIKRPVETCTGQFQDWQSEYQGVIERLREMWAASAKAVEILQTPSVFDSRDIGAKLEQAHHQATELEQAFRSPDVQDLAGLAQRVSATTQSINLLSEELQDVMRRLELFSKTISANIVLLDQIASTMNKTARVKKHPLAWGQYQAELERLRQVEAGIRVIAGRWTLDQIDERVGKARELAQKTHTLEDSVSDVLIQRDRLIQLLGQADLVPDPGWLPLAKGLRRQIESGEFASTDWPAELGIPSLLADANRLAQRHEQLLPAREGTFLPASQLGHRLADGQGLVDEIKAFQNRLQRIGSALNSRELETTRQTVAGLVKRMKDTRPALNATLKHQRNLEKLQKRSRQLTSEIERPTTKSMREKANRIADWTESCHKDLQTLPQALDSEVRKTRTQLRDEVQDLQKLAAFDREPAMQAARQLISAKRIGPPPISRSGDSRRQITLLVNRADELLQERATLYTALGNVQSQIRDQIKGALEKLEQARQDATRKFNELQKLKRDAESGWPPLLCDTTWAQDLIESTSRDEESARDSGRSVSDVLKYSKRLARRYKDVSAEIESRAKQHKRERQDLQASVDQIEHWQRQLDTYRRARHQDRVVAEAVQARISEINKATRAEKKRYRGKALTYNEAKRVLQSLWKLGHDRDLLVAGSNQPLRVRDIELGRR